MAKAPHLLLLALIPGCVTETALQDQPAAPSPAASASEVQQNAEWARSYVGQLQGRIDADPQLAVINDLEAAAAAVQQGVLAPWVAGWMTGDAAALTALLRDGSGLRWRDATVAVTRDGGGIIESALTVPAGADQSAAYLAGYDHIDAFSAEVVEVVELTDEATSVLVRFDLRGVTTDGARQQDRGLLEMKVALGATPRVMSVSSADIERLTATRAPAFADVSAAWGLDTLPVEDRKEAIRRGGYALVAADYDGDARADLLVGNYGPLQLLRNTGAGWQDVTAAAGLDVEGVVKSAAMADMDGDGDRDILLLRFVIGQDDDRGDFIAYANNGDGTFTRKGEVLPKRRQYDRAMPMTMGDFDADGDIDVYIGFPGIRDFTSGISNRGRPDWLASQGIWFNEGDWNFREAADGEAVITENNVYAHAAVATDADGDGHLDILVVDDSGRLNPLYKNDGAGSFSQVAYEAGVSDGGLSMGATTGDFNNDGHMDIMATNITLSAGQRIAASTEGLLDPDSRMGEVMQTLREEYHPVTLYRGNGDGTFEDVTAEAGIDWTGDAGAAGEWLDYNHDGLLDYYLPNGLWSSGPESLDSLFFRGEIAIYGDAILGYVGNVDESDPMANDVHGRPIFATNGGPNPVLSVLRNHTHPGNQALTWSMGGQQRNALYRNNGDGTFTEVGYLEGADRVEDGYIVAPVDIDGDGRQDLVLRNTDPAPTVNYRPVIALHNQLGGEALSVRLTSPSGNTDGLGARVIATIGDRTLVREVRGVAGAVQAEPVAYFGLDGATRVDRIEVVWPGGERQVVTNVAAGSVEIARD